MSVSFKSMTATLICSLCLLISISSGANLITSLFFIPSALKTLNDLSIGSILILSSLTSCLSISVWVHLESTNTYNHNFFLFFVLISVYMFNSLFLLFCWFRIIYQFWKLLYTKVHCIMPTQNLQQNSSCYHSHLICLILLDPFLSLSSVLTYSPLLDVCQAQFTPGWKSMEWTQKWADLWNDLGFSLCAIPSVYHMVATSDERKKVQVEVSTN